MTALARLLSGFVLRPVIDTTAMEGNFAITFTHDPGTLTVQARPGSASVFVAIDEQLGLKLQPAAIDVQAIVIDHIERPSEN